MPASDDSRSALAARMHGVVDDLLRGRVPEGFDETRARETARILALKRVDAMAHVRPEVKLLNRWRSRAVEFVLATPNEKCAHWDASMFAEWVRDHRGPDDDGWLVLDDVINSRTRWARIELKGSTYRVWRARSRVHSRPSLPC